MPKIFFIALSALVIGSLSEARSQQLVDFSEWQSTTAFNGARTSHASILLDNRVYILGGLAYLSKVVLYDDIQSATLGNDGSIAGGWRKVGSLPSARSGLGAASDNGFIYVVAGYSDVGTLDDTYYAAVKTDGTLTEWMRSPNRLHTPRSNLALQIFKTKSGNRYLIAIAGVGSVGQDTVHFDSVEVAAINADGSPGPWQVCPYHLKGGRSAPATLITNDNLYVLGGWGDLLIEDVFRDIQYAPLRDDGCPDPWHTNPYSLTMPLYGATAASLTPTSGIPVVVALGGNAGQGNYFNNVQFAPILKDGSIGAWTFDTHQFAAPRWGHVTVVYNSFLYVMGGAQRGGDGYLNDVQVSTVIKR
jgi:hypothetical protein